jgi:transcriptional regulator with XRE-family HTH domain
MKIRYPLFEPGPPRHKRSKTASAAAFHCQAIRFHADPSTAAQPTIKRPPMNTAASLEAEQYAPPGAVMGFVKDQLQKPKPLHASAPEFEPFDGAEDDEVASGGEITRRACNAALKKTISKRLVAAREISGHLQSEAARAIGYVNSTQLSLVEKGVRLPPLEIVIRASAVYGVSVDYLLGASDEPERDVHAASRNGAFRRMQRLLEDNTTAIVAVLVEASKFDASSELRAIRFVSTIADLLTAVDAFQAANAATFDDAPRGATLLRCARDADRSLKQVESLLARLDRRTEEALKRARSGGGD